MEVFSLGSGPRLSGVSCALAVELESVVRREEKRREEKRREEKRREEKRREESGLQEVLGPGETRPRQCNGTQAEEPSPLKTVKCSLV
jgi:hypothetical protein